MQTSPPVMPEEGNRNWILVLVVKERGTSTGLRNRGPRGKGMERALNGWRMRPDRGEGGGGKKWGGFR